MTRLLPLLLVVLLTTSCARRIPLLGKYQETPVKTEFSQPFEKVWENIIDFIADTGQEVQLIDRSSGLIISDAYITSGPYLSNEDKKGVLINNRALVAVDRMSYNYPYGDLPTHTAFAKWTIRAKELKNKNIEVSVLLHVKRVEQMLGKDVQNHNGKSTGLHEKWLVEELGRRVNQ